MDVKYVCLQGKLEVVMDQLNNLLQIFSTRIEWGDLDKETGTTCLIVRCESL